LNWHDGNVEDRAVILAAEDGIGGMFEPAGICIGRTDIVGGLRGASRGGTVCLSLRERNLETI
jgi:hypothetical protein